MNDDSYSICEVADAIRKYINTDEPSECDDCISRQALIKAIEEKSKKLKNLDTINGLCGAVNIALELPSVTPTERIEYGTDGNAYKLSISNGKEFERTERTGHWIDTGSGQECSECGEIQYGYDNQRYFCAFCGTRMVGDDNE